jgi:hypothetical protein
MWVLQRKYIAAMANVRLLFRRKVRLAHLRVNGPEAGHAYRVEASILFRSMKKARPFRTHKCPLAPGETRQRGYTRPITSESEDRRTSHRQLARTEKRANHMWAPFTFLFVTVWSPTVITKALSFSFEGTSGVRNLLGFLF